MGGYLQLALPARGVETPPAPEHKLPEKRALLEKTMVAAKDRGMEVYVMYADGGSGPGGDGYYMHDDKTLAARVARMVDTLEHFPMADGAVMDGPEWGYEMAPHHMNYRSYFFNDLPPELAPMAADLGYDYAAMVAAKDRLYALFHNFDPAKAHKSQFLHPILRYYSPDVPSHAARKPSAQRTSPALSPPSGVPCARGAALAARL